MNREKMDHYERSSLNGFVAHELDRATARRKNDTWIQEQMKSESARFVPLWRLKNLFTEGPAPRAALLNAVELGEETIRTALSVSFLGEERGRAIYAVELPKDDPSVPERMAGFGQFHELRTMSPILERPEGALLAYSRAVTYWHSRHRFCGDCGSPTRITHGGHIRVCTNDTCGQQHFPRTDPAIIVRIDSGDSCLLGRQAIWPKHRYSVIAGFVEPGETLEDAVVREVMEETGVRVKSVHYHSSQPWPFPSSLMLGFSATADKEDTRLRDHELEDARWFSRVEMESGIRDGSLLLPPVISIAFRLVEDWFNSKGAVSLRGFLEECGISIESLQAFRPA